MKQPIITLIFCCCISVFYTWGVWTAATVYHPVQQQIEINDWKERTEDCHYRLLQANMEIETLSKKLELDSLINQ